MQLDLTTFEVQIDPTILKRGQQYFKDGAVANLEELVKGHWYAEVTGTDDYEVELTLARTKVKYFGCSCPYDAGPVCKHVAAVLYALQKQLVNAKRTIKSPAAKKEKAPTKKNMLQEILDNVSYPDLKAFLLEYALKKNEFGGMLLARFAEQTGVEGKDKYVLIVKNAVSAGAGRNRFVECHNVAKVMKPVKELLQQARTLFARKQYAEVVSVCQAVIEEITELVPNMDDSAGHGSGVITDAFELLTQVAAEPVPRPLQEALTTYALAEADKSRYRTNGSTLLWYKMLDALAQDEAREKQVLAFVQQKLDQLVQQNQSLSKNDRMLQGIMGAFSLHAVEEQHLAFFLVTFYLKRHRKPEADAIIQKYRHIPRFREITIQQAVQAQQYALAKQYVQEAAALEKGKGGYNPNQNHWDQWLLRIAEQESNAADVRTLTAALFYRTYQLEYYRKYKQTYPPAAWPAEYDKLVKKLLTDDRSLWQGGGNLVTLFIEEQDWAKLFDYVRKRASLELLMQVAPYLKADYEAPLLKLLQEWVFTYAERNVNKPSYEFVTEVLNYMGTLEGGKSIVAGLVADFRELFSKRRTMMTELNKVKV